MYVTHLFIYIYIYIYLYYISVSKCMHISAHIWEGEGGERKGVKKKKEEYLPRTELGFIIVVVII